MSTFTDWHTGNKVIQKQDTPSDQFWSNAEVNYLNSEDAKVTSVVLSNVGQNTSTSIVVSDFRFLLPDDAEILGIEVKLTRAAMLNYSLVDAGISYQVKDIVNAIDTIYEYPPKGKDGGYLKVISDKAFKLENWDGTEPGYSKEELEYPDDTSLYETIVLGGTGYYWGLPDAKLTNSIINSPDFLFSTKVGVFGYDSMGSEAVRAGINSIEMRIEYYYVEPPSAPVG